MVAEMTGAVIRVIPTTDIGELEMLAYAKMLGPKNKNRRNYPCFQCVRGY